MKKGRSIRNLSKNDQKVMVRKISKGKGKIKCRMIKVKATALSERTRKVLRELAKKGIIKKKGRKKGTVYIISEDLFKSLSEVFANY